MKKVLFYLFSQPSELITFGLDDVILPHEYLACQKMIECWQQKKRVLVACQTQTQAEKIDEFLWQLDTEHFVPHNLAGEGLKGGTPVEICWPEKRGSGSRQILINLQDGFVDFAPMFQDIIDFVPYDEERKILARERYKAYKNMGFNLKTIDVGEI